jgi:5-methylcytosine-specific restriction endonuclease McrA
LDEDLEDGRLLGLLIRRAAKALAEESEQPPSEPIYRTVITLCPDCATASHPDYQVMDHVVTQALDDGEILDLTMGPDRGKLSRHIPERTRRAVLARDGYRCVFPGCMCNLFLDLHHILPFAQGGDHSERNLATVCTAHHAAAHEGHDGLFLDEAGRLMAAHHGGLVEPARVGGRVRSAA